MKHEQLNIFSLSPELSQNNNDDMQNLVDTLNKAAKAYYTEDREILSNKEYDAMYDRLVELEKKTGTILPDSPTQNVGYEVVSELKKVTHEIPARSLDKTKSVEDLEAFLGDKEGVLSWKMDGLTLQVTYDNGKLISAITRGNGIVGEDVTHNVPCIKGLPQTISYDGKMVIRGEVVISYHKFNSINEELTGREPYMNPRNLASGSLRMLDAKKAADRGMTFVCFQLVYMDGQTINDAVNAFQFLKSNHINVVDYTLLRKENVKRAVSEFADTVAHYQYPTDGLVLTYRDIAYGLSLGETTHHPKHSIAFKWKDETVTSTLRNVEWNASRTGLLNPVAVFDTVSIEGTDVSRASVHNISILQNLNLAVGGKVEVYKANMIIPQISSCDGIGERISIPTVCPVCGGRTIVMQTEDVKSLYCDNQSCPAKSIGRFVRLVERDALDVVGLAKKQLEQFSDKGWLNNLYDIFRLPKHKDEIIKMDGFGQKSYEKLAASIETARHTTFRKFFYALGITGAGHDAAKILESNMPSLKMDNETKTEVLERIVSQSDAQEVLEGLKGIGNVTATAIIDWFKKHEVEYYTLRQEISIEDNEIIGSEIEQDLAGMVFVVTGSLETYPNRNALKEEIEQRGGKVSGTVSKNTTYLINNDVNSMSGKNKKAKELSIPIISEETYKTL